MGRGARPPAVILAVRILTLMWWISLMALRCVVDKPDGAGERRAESERGLSMGGISLGAAASACLLSCVVLLPCNPLAPLTRLEPLPASYCMRGRFVGQGFSVRVI